jgi:hypothetical protein
MFLMHFAQAIGGGNAAIIESYFSANFDRFSMAPPGVVSNSAAEVAGYLSRRHAHHETWRLVAVNVAGPAWYGGADLEFSLVRAADDIPQGEIMKGVEGKAAIECGHPMIIAWAMTPPIGNPCPEADLNRNPSVVVACVRVSTAASP